jgi:hypothetical protein
LQILPRAPTENQEQPAVFLIVHSNDFVLFSDA